MVIIDVWLKTNWAQLLDRMASPWLQHDDRGGPTSTNLQSPLCSLSVDLFSVWSFDSCIASPPAAVGGAVVTMDRCVDCVSRSPAKLSFPAPSSVPPIKHIITHRRLIYENLETVFLIFGDLWSKLLKACRCLLVTAGILTKPKVCWNI